MHDDHFDQLLSSIVTGTPRRTLLSGLLGVAGVATANQAGAKKKKKKCKPPKVKCGKKCLAAGACCTNADCPVDGQTCTANTCQCPAGEVVSGTRCARPCIPACGQCQQCVDGACEDLAEDTPCSQGICRNGVCKPDRSFGCVTSQNACASGSGVACPDSTTSQAACFIDADGDSVCGTGQCTNVTTDAACVALLGVGAFVLPCPLCLLGAKNNVCVKPVTA